MPDKSHILIIDNNAELCESVQEFLSKLGVETVIAPNGRIAMTLLAERNFDVILLEIMLPDIDFSAILDHIHRSEVDSLVVLMSNKIPKQTMKHCPEKNVYGLLQKPFELTQLLTILQTALHQKMDHQLRRRQNRRGTANSGSHRDRRHLWKDRRMTKDPWYSGPERRSGRDRRARKDKMPPSTVGKGLPDPATDPSIVKRTYLSLFETFWPRRTTLVEEKRQHARVNVSWPLTIKGFPGAMRGKMKNVSTGGALICAANSLKRGEIFSIKIDRRSVSDPGVALLAKVVRSGVHCADDVKYPYGVAVEFVRVSDDARRMLSGFISQRLEEVATGSETRCIEEPSEGENDMTEDKGSIELIANPNFYPVMKVMWREAGAEDIFEATTPLNKEVWLNLATECRSRAGGIGVSQKMISCLNLVADRITSEITSEERRQQHREAYNSFADFIAEINARADLDKTRKAQIIHDRAHQLEIH